MNSRAGWSFSVALILSCTHLLVYYAAAATPANETDRLALLAFKDGISEDPFGVFNSWNDSLHFCEWTGITCSLRHHQRVTALNLTSRSLVGQISPHVGNLSFLRIINLSTNKFQGQIPQEISHLSRLRYLHLSRNSLSGEIPIDVISNCSELQVLALNGNYNLHGRIPLELGSLLKLFVLDLGNNNFWGGIPPSLGNLSSIVHFYLNQNNLDGSIPDEIGRLSSLKVLQISENNLSGVVAPALFNISSMAIFSVAYNRLNGILLPDLGLGLPNLINLYMGGNEFRGSIPVSLSNASSLQILYLESNNFSGYVPKNLGRLTGLQQLNLGGNMIGSQGGDDDLGFLTSLTNCSGLEKLAIGSNQLSGMLPSSIANLSTQLTDLWLAGNQVFGRIPEGIENLISLAVLKLDSNHLVGPIPPGIGKLKNLRRLDLPINKLSGQIPASFGNLTLLLRLLLAENDLEGTIPPSLGNFQQIQELDLHGNKLFGNIPKEVLNISSPLYYLDLSHNSFTGSLSSEVGNLKDLVFLDISENKLLGEIPTELGNCLSLVELYMEGNFIQGTIPLSLSNLGGIQALDFSSNKLSGQIPTFLGKFRSLQYLNLSFNNLEGEVPREGIFNNASAILIRGNKNLCGGIPILHLPKCTNQASSDGGKSHRLRVLIPVVCVSLLLILLSCSFAALHLMRKSSKKSSSISTTEGQHLKISYAELLKATDGFSSANLIGVGSYGSVYKGVLDRKEMIVAVKVLNLEQRGASKSFMAECDALRNIRHRNLVKSLTACSSIDFQGNDFKALVFEYMPNGCLEQWLHSDVNGQNQLRNLGFAERVNIAIDVAFALEYLHHHGQAPIVHRDLKPSNVLLDNDMNAHVSDFGLAKFLPGINNNSFQSKTSSVAIKGSIGYVAPEYGLGGEASIQGDVYSYGILLLEMFTGKRPTDDMFNDGLNLHQFAKMALPERVMEIADPRLLSGDETVNNDENKRTKRGRIQECLVSIVRVGVACSAEFPRERMETREVVGEMQVIRNIFLGVRMHGEME